MLNYIVPMFEDVFQRFRGELPPLTKAIIAVSDSFMNVFWVLLIIMLIIIYIYLTNRNRDWFRSLKTTLSGRTPVFGKIFMLTYKVRYCQTLALLVSSRIHLLKALGMLKSVIGYYPLEKDMDEIIKKISAGISLSEAMESSAFFDRKMIAMTKVGEEVNRLDTIYEQLYRQYSDELDVRIKTMNSLLEPLLIIFVGLMVGVILIAMYLPIFQLGINIGGN
jgi:type IV pilus assembly protein PilC